MEGLKVDISFVFSTAIIKQQSFERNISARLGKVRVLKHTLFHLDLGTDIRGSFIGDITPDVPSEVQCPLGDEFFEIRLVQSRNQRKYGFEVAFFGMEGEVGSDHWGPCYGTLKLKGQVVYAEMAILHD